MLVPIQVLLVALSAGIAATILNLATVDSIVMVGVTMFAMFVGQDIDEHLEKKRASKK